MDDGAFWQLVDAKKEDLSSRQTYRARVPGGWLYRFDLNVPDSNDSIAFCVSMVFVPKVVEPPRDDDCRNRRLPK